MKNVSSMSPLREEYGETMKKFEGTFVVAVTPFTSDEELDLDALTSRTVCCICPLHCSINLINKLNKSNQFSYLYWVF